MKKELIIGAHFEFNKTKRNKFAKKETYLLGVIEEMIRVGANGASLFVGPPQSRFQVSLDQENIDNAHKSYSWIIKIHIT